MSNSAFHLAATNIAACYDPTTKQEGWGVTLQVTFNASSGNAGQSAGAFDASAWDGISLWERRGTGPTGGAILVSIQDPYTAVTASASSTFTGFTFPPACDPDGTPDAGADCLIRCSAIPSTKPDPRKPPAPDATKCDPFGAAVGLTDDWQFVKIPFASAAQKGFGVPSPLGQIDVSALVGLQIALSPGDWDVWLDDIAFYHEPK